MKNFHTRPLSDIVYERALSTDPKFLDSELKHF